MKASLFSSFFCLINALRVILNDFRALKHSVSNHLFFGYREYLSFTQSDLPNTLYAFVDNKSFSSCFTWSIGWTREIISSFNRWSKSLLLIRQVLNWGTLFSSQTSFGSRRIFSAVLSTFEWSFMTMLKKTGAWSECSLKSWMANVLHI